MKVTHVCFESKGRFGPAQIHEHPAYRNMRCARPRQRERERYLDARFESWHEKRAVDLFIFLKERDVLLITSRMEFSLAALVPALVPMLADFKDPSLCVNSPEMSKVQGAVLEICPL